MTNKKSLLFSLVFLSVFCFQSERIFACFVGPPSDDFRTIKEKNAFVGDFNRAEAVFIGKVVSKDEFLVTFEVGRTWKGDLPARFIMSTGKFKLDNGLIRGSSCDYRFEIDKTYLVFAQKRLFIDYKDRPKVLPGQAHLLVARQSGRTKPLQVAKLGIENLNLIAPLKRRN